ncbi:MAG: DUF1295 domain-containing protein [Nitratireductor sp.]|nr:DUF1295 domain-containing protein [Nitratireductor sp.]
MTSSMTPFVALPFSSPFHLALASLAVIVCGFVVLWMIQVFTRDAGIVDYFWGPGFAIIGWIGVAGSDAPASVPVLLFMFVVTVWALRLAGQLIIRHRYSHGEDARYLAMRQEGGKNWWFACLFKVFLTQAVLLWLMAAPVHAATLLPSGGTGFVFMAGLGLALAGIVIEAVADWQLFHGKSADQKSTFKGGLWAVSRHPNYLGEIVTWCGLALSAFMLSGAWWVFAGPVLLSSAIVGITLPLTEQHMKRSRPDYGAYQASVPKLVPNLFSGNSGSGARTGNLGGPAE